MRWRRCYDFRRDVNSAMDAGEFGADDREAVLELLARIDSVLGVLGRAGRVPWMLRLSLRSKQ